jgi:hypothetical protein
MIFIINTIMLLKLYLFIMFLSNTHSLKRKLPSCSSSSCSQSCTGHDACKNYVWEGNYVISCGASNSERTCRSTTLNCGTGTCSIKTTGSGHDAYQQSVVNAKEAQSFTLTCQASGQRDCQNNVIWCPQKSGTTCNCVGCPSSVTMKCVANTGCSSTAGATIEYVASDTPQEYEIPDEVWNKDSTHTGKRPDCPVVPIANNGKNYIWGTLKNCKKACINEPMGICNMVSRYGEASKSATDTFHCWFYACSNPNNFTWISQTAWGNYASQANTYMLPIRHYITKYQNQNKTRYNYKNKTIYNYKNKTIYNYKNKTIYNYQNKTRYNYKNKTIYNYKNKTRYNYQNKTIYNYKNKTRYNYQNKTIYNYQNKTKWNIKNIINNTANPDNIFETPTSNQNSGEKASKIILQNITTHYPEKSRFNLWQILTFIVSGISVLYCICRETIMYSWCKDIEIIRPGSRYFIKPVSRNTMNNQNINYKMSSSKEKIQMVEPA